MRCTRSRCCFTISPGLHLDVPSGKKALQIASKIFGFSLGCPFLFALEAALLSQSRLGFTNKSILYHKYFSYKMESYVGDKLLFGGIFMLVFITIIYILFNISQFCCAGQVHWEVWTLYPFGFLATAGLCISAICQSQPLPSPSTSCCASLRIL